MSNWIGRGLRRGILTTRYPYQPDVMPERYRARPVMFPGATNEHIERGAAVCLSRAIQTDDRGAAIDMQRCFQCGECARVAPEAFAFTNDFELAITGDSVEIIRAELRRRTDRLVDRSIFDMLIAAAMRRASKSSKPFSIRSMMRTASVSF